MNSDHKLVLILSSHILDGDCTKKGKRCKICSIISCPLGSPYHNIKPGCPLCKPGMKFKCLTCGEHEVDLREGIEDCVYCRNGVK